jgi:hypothetical protein
LYTEIFVSVGWTIFTFAVGWSGRKWTQHRQEVRPAARVWRIDAKIPVHIVTADPPVEDPEELTPIVYPAEYAAATELSLYLTQTLNCNIRHICAGTDFLNKKDDSIYENIVIIGGPNHNPVFKRYLEELEENGLLLPYSFKGYELIRNSDNHAFSAKIDKSKITYDVGLVMLTANPLNERARVIFLAGCRTVGCHAAARAVSLRPLVLKIAALISGNEVEAFVVGAKMWEGHYPIKIDLLDHASNT